MNSAICLNPCIANDFGLSLRMISSFVCPAERPSLESKISEIFPQDKQVVVTAYVVSEFKSLVKMIVDKMVQDFQFVGELGFEHVREAGYQIGTYLKKMSNVLLGNHLEYTGTISNHLPSLLSVLEKGMLEFYREKSKEYPFYESASVSHDLKTKGQEPKNQHKIKEQAKSLENTNIKEASQIFQGALDELQAQKEAQVRSSILGLEKALLQNADKIAQINMAASSDGLETKVEQKPYAYDRMTASEARSIEKMAEISKEYFKGINPSTIAHNLGIKTKDVYNALAQRRLLINMDGKKDNDSFRWSRHLATQTGDMEKIEDLIQSYNKTGANNKREKTAEQIASEIRQQTGYRMSASTVYRMAKELRERDFGLNFRSYVA